MRWDDSAAVSPVPTLPARPPTSHSRKDLMPLPDIANYLMLSGVAGCPPNERRE